MSKVKIVLVREGVGALLKSDEMKEACLEQAERVRNRCGKGYEADSYTGRNRVNASVRTETEEAVRDNLQNNTLLKALGMGARTGKQVEGYWRTQKNGKRVFVRAYRRRG